MAKKEYKCPACGGTLEFNIKEQKLKCPYCDEVYEIADFADEKYEKTKNAEVKVEMNFDTDAGREWTDGEEGAFNVFVCESCGGEIVADDNLVSTRCPYCDTVMIRKEKLSGTLKPDYVIPFKLDKNRAREEFKKHILDKKLLDNRFADENKIDEIKGVYVPFWLFDVNIDANIEYTDVHTRSHRSGDYIIHESDYYEISQEGSVGFNTIPVDGSSKMADDLMESLEPFDFSEAVPFETAYLAGYMADKYDVTVEDSKSNIRRRVKGSAIDVFKTKLAATHKTARVKSSSIRLKDSKAVYALYPVWILTVKWKKDIYTYAMNAQTGKFVGDMLPEDKKKSKRMMIMTTGLMTLAGAVLGVLAGFIF